MDSLPREADLYLLKFADVLIFFPPNAQKFVSTVNAKLIVDSICYD